MERECRDVTVSKPQMNLSIHFWVVELSQLIRNKGKEAWGLTVFP